MTTAHDLRAEATRMREFARGITDVEVLAEIQELIDELERRAREFGNGDGQPTGAHRVSKNVPDREWNTQSHQRRSLSELTTDELLGRAQAYRDMAANASTEWTKARLISISRSLEMLAGAQNHYRASASIRGFR